MGLIADAAARSSTTTPLPDPGHTGSGPLGFVGNLVGDVKDLATGLAGLGSEVIHDAGRAVGQAVDAIPGVNGVAFGPINTKDTSGYHLDNIAKALPGALAHDYATRYGGLSNIEHGLYTHPLSYFLDALQLGGLAAGGARLVAREAVNAVPLAAAERGLVAEGLKLSNVSAKAADAAGLQSGLDVLAKTGDLTPLQNLASKILPAATQKRIGDFGLVPSAETLNPVTRGLESLLNKTPVIGKALSEPLQASRDVLASLNEKAATYTAAGRDIPKSLIAQRTQVETFIAGAEQMGIQRVASPMVAHMTEWNRARQAITAENAASYGRRGERLQAVSTTLKPFYGKTRAQAADFGARVKGVFFNADVNLTDLTPSIDTVGQGIEATKRAVFGAVGDAGTTKVVPQLLTSIAPDVRTRAETAIQPVLAKVDELVAAEQQRVANLSDEFLAAKGVTRQSEQLWSSYYQDALHRSVSAHLAAHDGTLADTEAAKEAMRLVTGDWNKALLESGDTITHQMEASLRPLAMKYGAHFLDGVLVGGPGAVEGGAPDLLGLADALRAAGHSDPIYFPFIDPERTRLMDFLLNKKRVGGVIGTEDKNLKLNTGALLKSGRYIADPLEAYTIRAARSWRAQEAYNLIHAAVQQQGRKITALDEATPGESYIAPEGLWRFFSSHVTFHDMQQELADQGVALDKAQAQALKHVVFHNQDELINSGITRKGMELYAVPKTVANQLDAYAKYAFNNSALRLFWDKPQDVWRAFVLGGSPRWFVNNTIGNAVFGALGTGDMRLVMKLAEERFKKLINEKLGTHLDTSLTDRVMQIPGISQTGSGFTQHGMQGVNLGATRNTKTGQIYERLAGASASPISLAKRYASFNTRLNGASEDIFRQASFLKSLERQQAMARIRPVASQFWSSKRRIDELFSQRGQITEGQVKAAITEMNNTMGNYGALGPLERNVVRRFFVPFYSYYRHQARVLVSLPFQHPFKAQLLSRLEDANKEFLSAYGPLPDYLQSAAPLGPPGPQVPFITSRGAEPFAPTFDSPVNMLSLPLKMLLERSQGKDAFTGQQFTDPNVVTPYGSDQQFRIIRDAQGNVTDVVPIQGTAPGIGEHVLSQIPQYQLLEQLFAGGKTYDSANLLSAIAGNAAVTKNGQTAYPKSVSQQLGAFAGFPANSYDLAGYQSFLDRQKKAALSAAISRSTP